MRASKLSIKDETGYHTVEQGDLDLAQAASTLSLDATGVFINHITGIS
jgi:hypothetical protein